MSPVLVAMHQQLPLWPRTFLFGDSPFGDLWEMLSFLGLYVCVRGHDEPCVGPLQDISARSRYLWCAPRHAALTTWFLARFENRLGTAEPGPARPLLELGMSPADVAEACLYVSLGGMTPEQCTADTLQPQRSKALRLALGCGLGPGEVKVLIKHMQPCELDLYLRALAAGVVRGFPGRPVPPTALHVGADDRDRWERAAAAWQCLHWWYAPRRDVQRGDRTADRQPEGNGLSLEDRIDVQGTQLRVALYGRAQAPTWHGVDLDTGAVWCEHGSERCASPYQLALKRSGNACRHRCRGRKDLLVVFLDDVVQARPPSRYPVSRFVFRRRAEEHIAACMERLLAAAPMNDVRLARRLSRRQNLIWEIYGLVRRYGRGSPQVMRLIRFADAFPSLMRIVPQGFLTRTVVPGRSLRKAIPYWSRWFHEEAAAPAVNYDEARSRLMGAVLRTLGVSAAAVRSVDAIALLDPFRFVLPFLKQERIREAFFVFAAREVARRGRDRLPALRELYAYVRDTGYMCTGDTTWERLHHRREAYLRGEAERRILKEIGPGRELPQPWMPRTWDGDERVITYIPDALSLYEHGQIQRNCVFSYLEYIRRGMVQIYAIRDRGGITLGTVAVRRRGAADVVLDDCLGPRNVSLSRTDANVVANWFRQHRSRAAQALCSCCTTRSLTGPGPGPEGDEGLYRYAYRDDVIPGVPVGVIDDDDIPY